MHLPDSLLAPLPGAGILFRILPARPASALAARRGQKQVEFRLPSSKGDIRLPYFT